VSLETFRRLLVGERLPTARAVHERLPKLLALPVLASDAVSSSAYATEEILLALALAGSLALRYSTLVAAAICALFLIVVLSYRQTVLAYPSGGGAYIVAKENLGVPPGLIAAAALLTDYVLTVAVSIAAGVAAVTSALPVLSQYRAALGVAFIAILALENLRGVRESGRLFAGPTYLFVGSIGLLLVVGAARLALGYRPEAGVGAGVIEAMQPLTAFLILRAFASGCAALTGIEAIANAVPAFRPPESRNAAATLLSMGLICVLLFAGITLLAQLHQIAPDSTGQETVLSRLGREVFGGGPLYYLLQVATCAILVLAANTSFAGFPRLTAILAGDGFAPRQLFNLGDRLVFSNGIVLLGAFSAALILIFRGRTHALIPLYAVGVFISFTLSQAGMVVHWRRLRSPGWRAKAVMNAVGAVATGVVLLVVISVKFLHGAWMVLLAVPLVVVVFGRVARHYHTLSRALAAEGLQMARGARHAVLVLVPGLHRGILSALEYAKTIATECEAVYVEINPADTPKLVEEWKKLDPGMPLTVLKSPWRSLVEPITRYINTVRAERGVDFVTIIVPEFVSTRWWHALLHNQSGLLLKFALMSQPGVVVTNVRYHLKD
jgi:amino acid transporter